MYTSASEILKKLKTIMYSINTDLVHYLVVKWLRNKTNITFQQGYNHSRGMVPDS